MAHLAQYWGWGKHEHEARKPTRHTKVRTQPDDLVVACYQETLPSIPIERVEGFETFCAPLRGAGSGLTAFDCRLRGSGQKDGDA